MSGRPGPYIWMLGGVHLLLHQTDETYWPSVYETGHSLSLINRWAGWTCSHTMTWV
jgi:hypothetical protein